MIEHPVPIALLALTALWAAVQLLREDRGVRRQAAAAVVIGVALVFAVMVQLTDVVPDSVEGPATVVVGALLAAVVLRLTVRRRRASR